MNILSGTLKSSLPQALASFRCVRDYDTGTRPSCYLQLKLLSLAGLTRYDQALQWVMQVHTNNGLPPCMHSLD